MKRYVVTIVFETDASDDLVDHIATDMEVQLETLEDEYDCTVNNVEVTVEGL